MHGKIRLCDMLPGERGRVFSLSEKSSIFERLRDLGLIKGTRVECVMKSPLGDPTAYLIRGALIALRRDDAKYVLIERMG
ncbi:MAG: ferrous iron transport protein A [Ruminococcaceae bacterium]|nr:ferrous iron transport protein A [Oscillospiraceae bacterium]